MTANSWLQGIEEITQPMIWRRLQQKARKLQRKHVKKMATEVSLDSAALVLDMNTVMTLRKDDLELQLAKSRKIPGINVPMKSKMKNNIDQRMELSKAIETFRNVTHTLQDKDSTCVDTMPDPDYEDNMEFNPEGY